MKDLLALLSLANLCLLPAWRSVLYPPFNGYHLESPPGSVNAAAVCLDVLLLTVAFWLISRYVKRNQAQGYLSAGARLAFLFLTIFAFNNLIKILLGAVSVPALSGWIGKPAAAALVAVLAVASLYAIIKWSVQLSKAARKLLLLASPVILLTVFQSASLIVSDSRGPQGDRPEVAEQHVTMDQGAKQRVVWIIFDEFDFRAAFESRPAGLELPELDRLRTESFFAINAFPPAGSTLRSLPALLTGKLVSNSVQRSPDNLAITMADSGQSVDWKSQANIFTDLQVEKQGTALVGWYHPYCRLFASEVGSCFARTHLPDAWPDKHSRSLFTSMANYFVQAALSMPLVREIARYDDAASRLAYEKNHVAVSESLGARAAGDASDPSKSFVFIHLPATHTPYLYSRTTHSFDAAKRTNYFDCLATVDDVLGNIRRQMEQSGTWDDSVLIVSADHWWRTKDWEIEGTWTDEEAAVARAQMDYRIPFIVKTAGVGDKPLVYTPIFNTVLTKDLVLAMRSGSVSTSADIASWVDAHRSIGVSGY